ncbi:restriction endonuclease subunit S [Streptomyces sp. NPDC088350]|uniref:restriction endonuclease subunit S n=1 Tax=Streptomyces sp. NPDC088350 TaxID=3365854 RepID=UPI003809B408
MRTRRRRSRPGRRHTSPRGGSAPLPGDWPLIPLKDLCQSLQTGPAGHAQDKGHTQADGGVPIVLPRDLNGHRIVSAADPAVVPAMSWERARTRQLYLLTAGDILLTRTGTVGRLALVTGEHDGWLFHPNLVRIRLPDDGAARSSYLAAYLSSHSAQDWVRTRAAGAVIPSVSLRTLGELPVPLPSAAEQRSIGETLAALDDKIRAHSEIARATGEYRDVLAEALLTGALTTGP